MAITKCIDHSDLFELDDPLADRPLRLSAPQDWVTKEKAWLLFEGKWQPPEPVLLRGYMGGPPAHFLWAGLTPLLCISQRVKDLLETNHFTGWATYPVEVSDRKGQHLPGYCGLAVTSSVGERDISRSQIVTKPPPVPHGQPYDVFRGIFFDESKWDGSDIFRVNGFKVVTRRVRDAFKRAKVTNVRFTPLPDVETSVDDYRIMGKL